MITLTDGDLSNVFKAVRPLYTSNSPRFAIGKTSWKPVSMRLPEWQIVSLTVRLLALILLSRSLHYGMLNHMNARQVFRFRDYQGDVTVEMVIWE